MSREAQVRFCERRGVRFPPPTLLVVCCHSRQQAEQVQARLAGWLEPRGLAFNEAKTRIVPLSEGFDFLGFNLRRYPNGKLFIKPGVMAIKRFRDRLRGSSARSAGPASQRYWRKSARSRGAGPPTTGRWCHP